MQCAAIYGLKFDNESVQTINDIKRRNYLFSVLSSAIALGSMATIFMGNGSLKSSFNISQTEFQALAKAMRALPSIQRRVISDIAREQQLSHFGNQGEFWKGVENGCDM